MTPKPRFERSAWSTPSLLAIGPMVQFTATGSGVDNEGGGTPAECMNVGGINRKACTLP